MPDGSQIIARPVPKTCSPPLTLALERLIACAERGARPDAVLRDIRALMRDHGLLLRGGGEAG
ncbi:MAG: hypothetical protein JO157_18320 [Acetobacteraceae bacterium]|nr:hypothetical protein [Acetobacteraceae bacterium]